MDPLLFIHIPKTAGSSLLKSAMDLFGGDAVERDYGPEGDYSSELVQKYIYGANPIDEYGFQQAFVHEGKKWLGGHFFADRYLHLFGAVNTLSFLRNPVDRVISEYTYLQHKHGLDRPFEEFYRAPEETNKQFRMIGQIPWKALRLVGTLDQYSECLALLANELQLDLVENTENKNPNKSGVSVDEETRADILKWNERDNLFYNEVSDYLRKRLSVHRKAQSFCFHDMGFVPDQHIIGWAFYTDTEMPTHLKLFVDGKVVAETLASEHRPELQLLNTPRVGHNGFRFELSQYTGAKCIELIASATDQTLLEWERP